MPEAKPNNIDFYNGIAGDYDRIMTQETANQLIRQQVAARFKAAVPEGWVLDFGGGTGLDMNWLAAEGYKIIFCEPSEGMRNKAILHNEQCLHYRRIIFLDDKQSDFRGWPHEWPFPQQVDAILSNFAAINNIDDLPLLFRHLALVTRPGGALIALVLDEGPAPHGINHFRKWIRSILVGKASDLQVHYKELRQEVYLHPDKTIKKAASEYFNCSSIQRLPASPFKLIHLVRK